MRHLPLKAAVLAVVLAAALLALTGSAGASHIVANLKMSPQQAVVGQPADIQVTLRSEATGTPLVGIPVTFYMKDEFAGVQGKVLLGTTKTNAKGLADLNFEPRVAGAHQVTAEYATPGEAQPETSSISMSIAGSTTQLYRSTAGVSIPGLSVWVLIAVVSVVWIILLSVALRIFLIARASEDAKEQPARIEQDGRLAQAPITGETGGS